MIRVDVRLRRPDFAMDVSFREGSSVLGVFGPSGSGKTTLINVISGLARADEGAIEVGGVSLFDSSAGVNLAAHRRRVGVVFQEHRLFPHLSVRGNLLYAARGRGELARIADLLGLAGLLDRGVRQLSGGEKQRVAIGRALLSRPRIMLFDEPLTSVDVRLRDQILPFLSRVRDESGVPMIYVSHDLTEILRLTDRVLFLENGRSVGHGRYTDVVHEEAVRSVVRDRGMENVLAARMVERRDGDGVCVLELVQRDGAPACRLSAPLCPAPVGSRVVVSIKPWDAALARAPITGVSIQNQARGTVVRCTDHGRSVLVQVDLGSVQPLIVEISRRAALDLPVTLGEPVVCLIKSHAISYVDGGT